MSSLWKCRLIPVKHPVVNKFLLTVTSASSMLCRTGKQITKNDERWCLVFVTEFSFLNVQQFCLSQRGKKKKTETADNSGHKKVRLYKEVYKGVWLLDNSHISVLVVICPVPACIAKVIVRGFMVTLRHVWVIDKPPEPRSKCNQKPR